MVCLYISTNVIKSQVNDGALLDVFAYGVLCGIDSLLVWLHDIERQATHTVGRCRFACAIDAYRLDIPAAHVVKLRIGKSRHHLTAHIRLQGAPQRTKNALVLYRDAWLAQLADDCLYHQLLVAATLAVALGKAIALTCKLQRALAIQMVMPLRNDVKARSEYTSTPPIVSTIFTSDEKLIRIKYLIGTS